jgi:hypothetical protein
VRSQNISFAGQQYWILPITLDAFPGIAAKAEGVSVEELQKRILRFLSVISWVQGKGAILHSFSGGGLPYPLTLNKQAGYSICDCLDLPYLPKVDSDRARLALALMREGRGLNHSAFSFLSFFRVVEIVFGDGHERRQWMASAIDSLSSLRAKEAIKELQEKGVTDIGQHLFKSGRCAIAHAKGKPIIDPDDPSDARRLYRELPIIEALAEIVIEKHLGIKTSSTVYKEHLYELNGFKSALGSEVISKITNNEPITPDLKIKLPAIAIRLRGIKSFKSLEYLIPFQIQQLDNRLIVIYTKPDGDLHFKFTLNFSDERLEFDIHDGIFGIRDDGSANFADSKSDITEFAKEYYLNGRLEIIDLSNNIVFARKDAFIPENVIVQPQVFDQEIDRWRSIAATRRESSIALATED